MTGPALIERAMAKADNRFRAIIGVGENEDAVGAMPASGYAPLFIGLPLTAQEGIGYSHMCAEQIVQVLSVMAGESETGEIGPEQLAGTIQGAVLRALIVGQLAGGGGVRA